MMKRMLVTYVVSCCVMMSQVSGQDGADTPPSTDQLTIQLKPASSESDLSAPSFSRRLTSQTLGELLLDERLPAQLNAASERQATQQALDRVNMWAIIESLSGYFEQRFAGRFDPAVDLIWTPIAAGRQLRIETPDLPAAVYEGPVREVSGFVVHDATEAEYLNLAVRVIQKARQLIDSQDLIYNRQSPAYIQWLADRQIAQQRADRDHAQATAREQEQIRQEIASALGVSPDAQNALAGDWLKESRRFSYIIKEGQFISRLQPLVDEINRRMSIAGFMPPGVLDQPGIYYDPEIGDVDIVLPKTMLNDFLAQADYFERRMAEDAVISIEAVRLTDRDIVSGALASRVNAQVQGVHDVSRFGRSSVFRELGLNSLLAVANQQLQVRTLSGISSGTIPEGVAPVIIGAPTLPPIQIANSATTVGSTFSIGADDIFFDGRQQITGFSYLGPDGLAHTLSLEVVDSLQEFWNRIERNLIVHKIKKTDGLTEFSVPVGPNSKTYNGIAALISQENQQLVVATGTGAISEISATAGTWLIIEDFEITPIPGSSTTLTEDEVQGVGAKVLLTMFLRDPYLEVQAKRELLHSGSRESLWDKLQATLEAKRTQTIRPGRNARTYGQIFDERNELVTAETRQKKKERNSVITLTFYSSQGNIIQQAGSTQLGDSNDLTSFTTELTPNVVTPISSFFTKSGSGATGTSPLSGSDRGERVDDEKTMAHLVVRARFPTVQREQADRDEGRHMGYFQLPMNRTPASQVDLPFLSSSEHPVERLAKLRIGLMFEVLDASRISKPFARFNPNKFPGDVPRKVWESAQTRLLMNRKIMSDSPGADENMPDDFVERFIIEVRSLLEFDEDFFNSPNLALRNMGQWNDPDRIVVALNNSAGRFAMHQLLEILDQLGGQLVPDDYAEQHLAVAPKSGLFSKRRLYPLSDAQLTTLRRDVAAHYLRYHEAYGDAFLEAVSMIAGLGTYRSRDIKTLRAGPFRGYQDLVLFDNSSAFLAEPKKYEQAHEQFMLLKEGGYQGSLFEPSLVALKDLTDNDRRLVYHGKDILTIADHSGQYDPR